MHAWLVLIMLSLSMGNNQSNIDFGSKKDGQNWTIINDGVMGGLSKGYAQFTDNTILFKGQVSLENNGGFTSLRSPFQPTDLSAFTKVRIRLKSKGQTFALTFETDRRWYFPYYKKALNTESEEWEVIELPLSEFQAYSVGRSTGKNLTAETLKEVIRIGFITNDKKATSFEFEVDYIEFE